MNQHVKDDGDLRKYRTELPNMADDELDPYQYRLYAHYKRVCGANGGTCWEGRAKTADTCKMSEGMVTKTRAWLANNGWIHLERGDNQNDTYNITIIDRWSENMTRYSDRSSCGDDRSHEVTTGRHEVTQRSNSFKNKPKEEIKDTAPTPRPVSEHQQIVNAYVTELAYTPPNMGREVKAAKWLVDNRYSPDLVIECYRHMKRDKFWSDKFLSLQKVAEQISEFSARHKPAAKLAETRTVGGVIQEKIGGVWYNKRNSPTGAA